MGLWCFFWVKWQLKNFKNTTKTALMIQKLLRFNNFKLQHITREMRPNDLINAVFMFHPRIITSNKHNIYPQMMIFFSQVKRNSKSIYGGCCFERIYWILRLIFTAPFSVMCQDLFWWKFLCKTRHSQKHEHTKKKWWTMWPHINKHKNFTCFYLIF